MTFCRYGRYGFRETLSSMLVTWEDAIDMSSVTLNYRFITRLTPRAYFCFVWLSTCLYVLFASLFVCGCFAPPDCESHIHVSCFSADVVATSDQSFLELYLDMLFEFFTGRVRRHWVSWCDRKCWCGLQFSWKVNAAVFPSIDSCQYETVNHSLRLW